VIQGQPPSPINSAPDSVTYSFGPFRLSPAARAFEKDGAPVSLGHRALDILVVLVERAGNVVSHRDLVDRVWRGLVVDPSNLRVHMTGLRKVLGDRVGKEGYIANVAGQGYCFVAPVVREARETIPGRLPQVPVRLDGNARQRFVLPTALARMVGRDEVVQTIVADLLAERFVTLIGPGGLGKTTVAVSVAQALLGEFAGAVCFVDIGAISDPKLLVSTVASSIGLTVQTDDVLPALMMCLRSLRILLVLDNCEHLVDAAATLAERIFQEADGVHILATSREAMRVEGEHAYWLPPLPEASAVELFIERAAASGRRLELNANESRIVAGICERLDGLPLAIEFAAARVVAHGIAGTAELLKTRLGLYWPGRRTAIPRHQTLHALLDWSYAFLDEPERIVLRRLAVFVSVFSLEAAQAVAIDEPTDVVRVVDSLVAKSLVSPVTTPEATRYRLLETTRVYAMEQLEQSGEQPFIALRHAKYFATLLSRIDRGVAHRASAFAEHLPNARAALEWAHGDCQTPDKILAVDLTTACVPIFLELSLLSECLKWSLAALGLLDSTNRGSQQEVVLQEALAVSSTWTRGNGDDVRTAITRALEIAQSRSDIPTRLRLLAGLHMSRLRVADIRGSLAIANEFAELAQAMTDRSYLTLADGLLGCSHHFLGNQLLARQYLQKALTCADHPQLFGLDYRLRGLICYHRALWLSGFAVQALEVARQAILEAEASGKPLNVCFACLYTVPFFLWKGDWEAAREVLEKLMTQPSWHALPSMHATAAALQGELLIRQGDTERGLTLLRSAVPTMRADRQTIQLSRANCAWAEGLAAAGKLKEALDVISLAIEETEAGSELCQLPEMLRVRGEILLAMPDFDARTVEAVLMRSLGIARQQSASAWESRTATTLEKLHQRLR
jgi:predicted ATPase/DNA-binding winged helix-turn-helix (wHTH) protein